jgi:outer membrane protein assembly factor BamA
VGIQYAKAGNVIALALLLISGTAMADPSNSDFLNKLKHWWDPQTSPFIPLPEIATDPNAGTAVGFLPVFLITDKQQQIRQIIAPDVLYNANLGIGGHFRYYSYPSTDTQWYALVGAKQKIEREIDIAYSTGLTRQRWWSHTTHLAFDRSATERFFGVGNTSKLGSVSNFTLEQLYIESRFGINFTPNFQIALELRPRYVAIEHGVFKSVPFIGNRFPQLHGLGSNHELLTRLLISYDTRDSIITPSRGSQITIFAGIADKSIFSTVSYTYFGLEARHFRPINERMTLATHATIRYMPVSKKTPFWALSHLGGERSIIGDQQPLRGYGDGRFIDNNLFVANAELRIQAFSMNLFSTQVAFETAPFIEAGQVFHNINDNPVKRLHFVGGIGFRGIAKPFVVGRVDVGYGSEGLAIYSGINYPF